MGHIYKSLCPVQSLTQIGTVVVSLHDLQWFMFPCLWPSHIEWELGLHDQPTIPRCWCMTSKARKSEALAILPHFLRSLIVLDTSCHVMMSFKQRFYNAHVEVKLSPWIKAKTKLPALQWILMEVTPVNTDCKMPGPKLESSN